ncbi:MAG: glycosyltransferase family 4 protein [Myxococcota bacterium]
MKALHFVKTATGATWALLQMRELVKLGVEVHVAMPEGALTSAYEAAGVRVHALNADLPTRQPWRAPALRRDVRRLVADVRPDVIHSHFVGTTLALRAAMPRSPVPRFFQVPGPLHLEHALFRQLDLRSAGPADFWIGSCRWTCDRYRAAGVAGDRVFLGYYGVDTEKFQPKAPGRLRAELGLAGDARIVGMVAYFYAPKRYLGQTRGLKGHEDLVDALARLDDPRVVGVFVGGAWGGADAYEARVRAYAARRLGARAVFLGTRRDVAELYADFDVVVHPSHSENVGGAGESLLLAVPTIASDVGGLPDLVVPGETGWLVPPRAPEAIAAAVREALADPGRARATALRGQARARAMMDARPNAARVHAIYREVLQRHV